MTLLYVDRGLGYNIFLISNVAGLQTRKFKPFLFTSFLGLDSGKDGTPKGASTGQFRVHSQCLYL